MTLRYLWLAAAFPQKWQRGRVRRRKTCAPISRQHCKQCHGLAEERAASTATSRFTALPASSVSRGDL